MTQDIYASLSCFDVAKKLYVKLLDTEKQEHFELLRKTPQDELKNLGQIGPIDRVHLSLLEDDISYEVKQVIAWQLGIHEEAKSWLWQYASGDSLEGIILAGDLKLYDSMYKFGLNENATVDHILMALRKAESGLASTMIGFLPQSQLSVELFEAFLAEFEDKELSDGALILFARRALGKAVEGLPNEWIIRVYRS
jgi:hypothetical protein